RLGLGRRARPGGSRGPSRRALPAPQLGGGVGGGLGLFGRPAPRPRPPHGRKTLPGPPGGGEVVDVLDVGAEAARGGVGPAGTAHLHSGARKVQAKKPRAAPASSLARKAGRSPPGGAGAGVGGAGQRGSSVGSRSRRIRSRAK